MSSVFPRLLSRVKATLLIGLMSIAFIFIGRFAANLVQSVSTFAVLIITCTTPWMVMMIIGLIVRRWLLLPGRPAGVYPRRTRRALLVQSRLELARPGRLDSERAGGAVLRQPAGAVCRATGATSPTASISALPVTLGLASVVYLTLLRVFPEPACVYGPTVVARELAPAGLRSGPKKAGASFSVGREQAPSPQQARQ